MFSKLEKMPVATITFLILACAALRDAGYFRAIPFRFMQAFSFQELAVFALQDVGLIVTFTVLAAGLRLVVPPLDLTRSREGWVNPIPFLVVYFVVVVAAVAIQYFWALGARQDVWNMIGKTSLFAASGISLTHSLNVAASSRSKFEASAGAILTLCFGVLTIALFFGFWLPLEGYDQANMMNRGLAWFIFVGVVLLLVLQPKLSDFSILVSVAILGLVPVSLGYADGVADRALGFCPDGKSIKTPYPILFGGTYSITVQGDAVRLVPTADALKVQEAAVRC